MGPRQAILVPIALGLCSSGCGAHHHATPQTAATRAGTAAPRPLLTGAHPCPSQPGFTCSTLRVPLDHAGQTGGTLALAIGATTARAAPRGVLLFLTGGPGQPGIPFLTRIKKRLRAALAGYRLLMFDQRGTGAGALRCPALQAAAGSSDLATVPAGTVAACASRLGAARRYYSTAETVADIDELRTALGAPRLTLDGVSYGTFVAERYALAYPSHVARMVLDSVVPQAGADPLYRAALSGSSRVLRSVCAAQRCGWDPAGDLAAVVARFHDGPEVLNALVASSVVAPDYPGVLAALHAARAGRPAALQDILTSVRRGEAATSTFLSQGLHESTICLELASPWDPAQPRGQRATALTALAASTPDADLYPFDRATAVHNGLAQGCLGWPPTEPPSVPDGSPAAPLPPVPVLLLSGERDLSTPLAWARTEAELAPQGQLLEVPAAGHSVQLRARDPDVRRRLARFLSGAQ
ncbi:MAG: alpha/beta fold hydrolase [Solirubrobacterales bacterium]|nr:alpha/beta fold hydrolase [Solirubrobacterales bacterium]MBV9942315.1 alpha/beta fold hydrolase [Solirubrobacterales bacterium]